MRNSLAIVLAAGALLFVRGPAASGEEPAPHTTYTNVVVVSVDAVTRLVVVTNPKGTQETFELDDGVAGAAGLKAGDRVMVAVREQPGRKRISKITKLANPAPAVVVTTTPSPAPPLTPAEAATVEMRTRFANLVAAVAQDARPIDSLWSSFVTTCGVRQTSSAVGGREWFGLWDGRVKADLSSGFCRDLFNQIVSSGEGIKKAMASADDVARKTLSAGEIRDIRQLNSLDWEGWALPPPAKLEP